MSNVVKKTISMPVKLAKEIDALSEEEGKSLSAVIQEALKNQIQEKLKREFYQVQGYWSKKAIKKGILTEKDLNKYLRK